MIGLCHSCKTSGVEVEIFWNMPSCERCIRLGKIAQESEEMFKNGTQGKEIDI